MNEPNTEALRPMPGWAIEVFEAHVGFVENVSRVLHLSMQGFARTQAIPQAVRALARAEAVAEAELESRLHQAESDAEFARSEVDQGFPVLHAQATVQLWTALEDLHRSFLTVWLQHVPSARDVPPIKKLKIRLGEYLSRTEEERYEYLVEELEREISSGELGVGRFESILSVFDLDSPVEESVRKSILELQQLRHVIVHRRGIADRKLATNCPWLNIGSGSVVRIRHSHFAQLAQATDSYAAGLIGRARARYVERELDGDESAHDK